MKKQILFFAVAGLIGQAIYTFNPKETYEKPLPFATHALLIFLDDSEEGMGALATDLFMALSLKAGPILASASLFAAIEYNPTLPDLIQEDPENKFYRLAESRYTQVTKRLPELIASKNNAVSRKDQEEVVFELNKEFPIVPQFQELQESEKLNPLAQKIDAALMRQVFTFNPDDWIIKIVDREQRLLLLIPKNYTPTSDTSVNLKNYTPRPKKLDTHDPLTAIEYQLGLKIDHMETIKNYTDAIPEEFQPKEYADYFMQALWPTWPIQSCVNCSDIFVSNAEYSRANRIRNPVYTHPPRWLICASGHGQVEDIKKDLKERSIGLTLDMFKQFLDFMNSKINTSLFFYFTCFAFGTNAQQIYQDERQLSKAYSFIIITQGVTDSLTSTIAYLVLDNFEMADIDFHKKTLQPRSQLDYAQFIKNFTTVTEITNFEAAISPIIALGQEGIDVLEVPHIRLKGKDFFRLADINNKIAAIGNIFTKTCTTVDLAKYFSKNGITPEYYLIYAPNIACELILSSDADNKPYFIPMFSPELEEEATIFEYHIKKITAPHLSLGDIITTCTKAFPADNNGHIQIDDLTVHDTTLVPAAGSELVLREVSIEIEEVHSDLPEKFDQLIAEQQKLLQEHSQLLDMQKLDEAAPVLKKINEINAQSTAMLKQIELEGPETYIDCYFMYNNTPYKFDQEGKPAIPLPAPYISKHPLSATKKFEKINELQKKHILLQQLEKAKAQGVAK